MLDAAKRQHKIRLAEIDAPELSQANGQVAKRGLSKLCYRKDATIRATDQDRYGRLIGQVNCQGIDANAEMVRQGYAWVYDQYAPSSSPLYPLQGEAKRRRLGLWDDVHARPPWEWRRAARDVAEPIDSAKRSGEPVRGNRSSGVYHMPHCPNYPDVSERNRVPFGTEREAQNAGYRRAKNCS